MRNLQELPKLRDSLSYLYLEHGRLEQDRLSVSFIDKDGRTPVPAAGLSVLLLGPGASVTHAAVKALADNGCLLLWTGEDGMRLYAQGSGETRKAYHLLRQAELAGDPAKRMAVVRRMYEIRFTETLDPSLSLEQIRGMEGARVRTAYAWASQEFGVPWHGRNYDRNSWGNSDPINRALSQANGLLNGLCHAAIVAGGYSPGLGFVHTGKQLSFVYDIADLYKVEITIPVAFWAVSLGTEKLDSRVRQGCREAFKTQRLLDRILPDIDKLLGANDLPPDHSPDPDTDPAAPGAWWGPDGEVEGGRMVDGGLEDGGLEDGRMEDRR
ncbi:MAG: type I-E CRISPR-associated endonuclease Cas1 [Anaerolineales bacterium]|nr:type I-E CRISPR-associated endonuclease Cas1 [Anaerolineales bacterium]